MKRGRTFVAWTSVVSTLFVGCYSAAMIDPAGEERERITSSRIDSVLSKDGTMYEFQTQPTVTSEAIVGEAKVRPSGLKRVVSVPVSEVAHVYVSELDLLATAVCTTLVVLGTFASILVIGSLIIATEP
jgi:hypothetical protein